MKKSHIYLIAVVVAVATIIVASRPRPLAAPLPPKAVVDQIIDAPGHFRSPSGNLEIKIGSDDQSNLAFVFSGFMQGYAVNDKVPKDARSSSQHREALPFGKAWFFCWDDGDHLWFYHPDAEPQRLTISQEGMQLKTPGVAGGWEGVPAPFVERLPEEVAGPRGSLHK